MTKINLPSQDAMVDHLAQLRQHCADQNWDFDTLADFARHHYLAAQLPTRLALSGKAKKEQARIRKFGYGV